MAYQKPAFSPEACRLETSARSAIETDKIEGIQIFKHDRAAGEREKLLGVSVDVVYAAWAKLLRSYVYSDTISFGTLLSSDDDAVQAVRDKSNGFLTQVDSAQICQYHNILERQWGEWLPDVYQDIFKYRFKETQINTAVHLWVESQDSSAQRREKCIGGALAQCVSCHFFRYDFVPSPIRARFAMGKGVCCRTQRFLFYLWTACENLLSLV